MKSQMSLQIVSLKQFSRSIKRTTTKIAHDPYKYGLETHKSNTLASVESQLYTYIFFHSRIYLILIVFKCFYVFLNSYYL